MVRLFDIPGIPAIENRTRLNALTGVREDHDLDRMILELIAEVFALKPDCDPYDVGFYIEDDDSDEDAITAWRQDGWDVTGPDGNILECLDRFAWNLAAAGEGLTQRSMIELEALAWGEGCGQAKDGPSRKDAEPAILKLRRSPSTCGLTGGWNRKISLGTDMSGWHEILTERPRSIARPGSFRFGLP